MGKALWIAMSCSTLAAAEPPRHPRWTQWISSWDAARAAAKESGKPLMVVFRCEP